MENNLSYYKIFYTVATTGNISKAAKELYISQPAISKAITKLEQNLETVLFLRSSRGVQLTFEGNLLFEQLKIAFHAISSGESLIKNAAELTMGHLRIGVSTTLCKYILLPYLQDFIIKYPNIKISIECQATYAILDLLDKDEIDIGLVAKSPIGKNIDYYSLGEIEDVFVASESYLAKMNHHKNLSTKELLENSTLMLLDKGNITRQHVDSYLQDKQIRVNNFIEVTSMDLLIDFAKIGIGIACVIKNFISDELTNGELTEIALDVSIPKREIGFVCNNSNANAKSLQYFLEMMNS